ncbi:ABC-F family ATP-binding cassette domain-containing protein [Stenotrophomonas sp. MMGLT7]|uniref:ABC-F family ATP-binding cassette domain-containing protein n=1 Tax=Stenotrophomonas sp. MMGLT7 TaxID=2901227 RepID=UPI001E44CF8B|nr:ABC-F family ATP-binding cassette domain-containing protein [Stenotrophomonas sp. MMGLT7]MCD7098925.1 ATP-binding cassette domain-containing protein [Stenotrophomonas sp. MMGLT7]
MTHPSLSLEGVSHVLPDGRRLFPALDAQFDSTPTGLVGRNGVGKSVLARILAGELEPSCGRCRRPGRVHYLPQQVACAPGDSVATLAGVAGTLAALERIEAGSCDVADFERVGEDWDLAARLAAELQRQGLGGLDASTPAARLSGGEAMRVALAGAWLAQADFLILDEPSNHLDRAHRLRLIEQLGQWPRGLLVVSHDRELLQTMGRIVELSPAGLRDYGGGYAFYAQCRAQERQAAQQRLQQRRLERQRGERALQEQHERMQRRSARGNREARDANQAKILLDRQKDRSQASAGRLRQLQAAECEQLDANVREAVREAGQEQDIAVLAPLPADLHRRTAATLEGMRLPFGPAHAHALDLVVTTGQRVALTGGNGAGKSSLLRVLSGQLAPAAGICRTHVATACLDQRLDLLDPDRSVLEQMQAANPAAAQSLLRTRLALLGLDAARIGVASGLLSGGERLKAALACVLHARHPPELLLLDEPGNHLDLPSLQALEQMLAAYPGALLVASHDEVFLDRLGLQLRLHVDGDGWQLLPWRADLGAGR